MKKLRNEFSSLLPSALLVCGAAAVSLGAGMIYRPAGVLAAGALSVLAGILLIWGGDRP